MPYVLILQLGIFHYAIYDGIVMYAHALRATIDAGEDYRNATKVIGNLWNKTYEGNHYSG